MNKRAASNTGTAFRHWHLQQFIKFKSKTKFSKGLSRARNAVALRLADALFVLWHIPFSKGTPLRYEKYKKGHDSYMQNPRISTHAPLFV